jgi:hypothetical protein
VFNPAWHDGTIVAWDCGPAPILLRKQTSCVYATGVPATELDRT